MASPKHIERRRYRIPAVVENALGILGFGLVLAALITFMGYA